MKVCIIFHRLGPYHVVRLSAVGRLLPVVAIESSGVDKTYAWDVVAGVEHFERTTLFNHADAQKLPMCEVVSRVGSVLDKARPAVVVVPGWADSAALGGLRWCIQNHCPAIVMSESQAIDEFRSLWKEFIKQRVVKCFSAALVGGIQHADYIAKLGMPQDRIYRGYDAVDNHYFTQGAQEVKSQKSELRRKHGLPEKYFLASARFVQKKNMPRLLQAYARYRELVSNSTIRNPQSTIWSLVLLGDGVLRAELEKQVSALGLQSSVSMPGFKQYPDLPAYYGLASAFVHASTTEQWGLVVNEAMASGLPVLVSDRCGCTPDLVEDGVNGFTFDPHDVEALAQLMLRISSMLPAELSQLGSESQRIIANWGPERFASGLKEAVDNALEVGPKKASLFDRLLLKALLYR